MKKSACLKEALDSWVPGPNLTSLLSVSKPLEGFFFLLVVVLFFDETLLKIIWEFQVLVIFKKMLSESLLQMKAF